MSARAPRLATAEDLLPSRDDERREVVRGVIVSRIPPGAERWQQARR